MIGYSDEYIHPQMLLKYLFISAHSTHQGVGVHRNNQRHDNYRAFSVETNGVQLCLKSRTPVEVARCFTTKCLASSQHWLKLNQARTRVPRPKTTTQQHTVKCADMGNIPLDTNDPGLEPMLLNNVQNQRFTAFFPCFLSWNFLFFLLEHLKELKSKF